jgi:uncharacterized protein YPO0396
MLPESFLSLTRIFLHNWHRFQHDVIEVEDSLYLAGHNGSGKSSVLDALQVVLIADLVHVRFNSSAQDKSDRNLDTYVRGKLGEDYWLRPGNTIAYIALEFADPRRELAITLGVCIEAGEGRTPDRTYFILTAPLEVELFVPNGQPRKRADLRKLLRQRRGAKVHDNVTEYRDDLLNALGGLNPRFFELFLKALRFEPIRNIGGFVEQWLLDKKEVHIETLQSVRENLQALKVRAERVEQQLQQLNDIVTRQQEVQRWLELRDQYTVLMALLRAEDARRRVDGLRDQHSLQQHTLDQVTSELATVQASLAGAEEAQHDAQRRYYESDVVRHRGELQVAIDRLNREADDLHRRWASLRSELRREADLLRPLIPMPIFTADESEELQVFATSIDQLAPDRPPVPEWLAQFDHTLPMLNATRQRIIEGKVRISDRANDLERRRTELQREIEELEQQGQIRYRREVERLQDLLTPIAGQRPTLLCEQIEITEARWQDAVEALLGARRFNLIVPPEHFKAAVRELDRARANEALYDVGLIDLAKVTAEAQRAQLHSLATYVSTDESAVRAYIDHVLGDIIACESVDELRQYRRAVTPQVVVYGDWTVRAVNPKTYRPHFIGQRARQSQIEARRREQESIGAQLAEQTPLLQSLRAAQNVLDHYAEWIRIREKLNVPLDEQPLREQIHQHQAELAALDLSGVAELEREVNRLAALISGWRDREKKLIARESSLKTELINLNNVLVNVETELAEATDQASVARAQYPEAVSSAEELLAQRQTASDLHDETRKADSKAKEFDTKANNAQRDLAAAASAYNREFDFAGQPGDQRDERYQRESERLAATDLPRYKEQINAADRQAEFELREHVLHTLREQIENAKRAFSDINHTLNQLPPFSNERYTFRYEPNDDLQEFYRLVTADSQLLGTGPLFESQFYHEHQATFDRFYEQLTRKPATEAERREQDDLIDYRRYLKYDIEVSNVVTGQKSRLSKIMNQTSGGETQTPFYLTIAASFVQLYRIHERSGRPTLRLVVFDEAFSKMDQDRIGSTLDLFQRFHLQIVTATPLERCEYLVPKMCTNLVLTVVNECVHLEPYLNYAARLDGNGSTPADRA